MGSIALARRAGTKPETAATAESMISAETIVQMSFGFTL